MGSSQGEVDNSRHFNPGTRSEIELSLSGDEQDSGSQSSEEAAFGQAPAHSEARESVQAFEITTKQVVLDCTEDYCVTSCFEIKYQNLQIQIQIQLENTKNI